MEYCRNRDLDSATCGEKDEDVEFFLARAIDYASMIEELKCQAPATFESVPSSSSTS